MSATAGDEEKSVDRHIRVSALVAAGETLTNEDAAWLVRVVEQARGLFTEKNRTIRHLRGLVDSKQERILVLNEEIETLTADLESVRSTVTASIAERARLETELDSMRGRQEVHVAAVGSRRGGPSTQQAGERDVRVRAGSQRYMLLAAFADGAEMTPDEARRAAGLDAPRVAYWVRVSELERAGLLELTGAERNGEAGSAQRVLRITEAGRTALT